MLQLLLGATCIKLDWLLRFTTGKKCRRVFCNLWCTSRLVRVIVRPTWRGNELIQSRRLLLGIFLHTVGKSILSACLHFLPSWSSPNVINAFPAPRLCMCLSWFRKEGSKLFNLPVCWFYPFFLAGCWVSWRWRPLTQGILIPHQPWLQTFIQHPGTRAVLSHDKIR